MLSQMVVFCLALSIKEVEIFRLLLTVCFIVLINVPIRILHLSLWHPVLYKSLLRLRIFASVATLVCKIYFLSLSFAFLFCS